MGASIGQALGLEKAGVETPTVAVIGDSTFMHSGITPLVDVVYNQGRTTIIILDNGTTAMTGHQGHPGTGISAKRETAAKVDLETLVRGIGVRDVVVVDAFDLPAIQSSIRRSLAKDEPSVIIARGPCPLHIRVSAAALVVDQEQCNACGLCLRLGCPAIIKVNEKAAIDPLLCVGASCSLCLQVCPREAIHQGEGA
jgi:indolepyruvate ferredoxin oxidoreductase alpha subunit